MKLLQSSYKSLIKFLQISSELLMMLLRALNNLHMEFIEIVYEALTNIL